MTNLTTDQLENLIRLSREATPGPWTHLEFGTIWADGIEEEVLSGNCDQVERDGQYIAACFPETIRNMAEEILRLRGALDEVVCECQQCRDHNRALKGTP